MLDSNDYEIIMPSSADFVNPDGDLGILIPNILSKNENNIFTENSEDINENEKLIMMGTVDGSNKENNIETITEYGESKWIDENSTGMSRIQDKKYNIDSSVGLEESKIEFGHKTTQANNYIHLRTKRRPTGIKNIYYTCLGMVFAASIFSLTALKASALVNIMKKVESDKIPPLINEKILQNLGMIEGKKQLEGMFSKEHKKFKYRGKMKAELFSKIMKDDYNIGVDSTTIFKEFEVYHYDENDDFDLWRLNDIKTGEVFEQLVPITRLTNDILEIRKLQEKILKILCQKGETVNDVVKRVGLLLSIYESNHIPQGKIKMEQHISNSGDTEEMQLSDIFEASEELSDVTLSQCNWSARKYISRQLMLIINELHKKGVINHEIVRNDIWFNAFGEIRLGSIKFDIYNKNDEGHSNDFEDKSKDEMVAVGEILEEILFENNEEKITEQELNRWKELKNKCIRAKELKAYSISDLIDEFSDILGPLDN